jgi:hypothetical protein
LPPPKQKKMLREYKLNELKTGLGNLQQHLCCCEGFSASLYMPNYRQNQADTHENKSKRKKRELRRVE